MKALFDLYTATEEEKENLWSPVSITKEHNFEEMIINETIILNNAKLFLDEYEDVVVCMSLKDKLLNKPAYRKYGVFTSYFEGD